jgi:hypothetical protein
MRHQLEVLAQAGVDLIDRRFGGRHVPQRVQHNKIVNRAVVANRVDDDARARLPFLTHLGHRVAITEAPYARPDGAMEAGDEVPAYICHS